MSSGSKRGKGRPPRHPLSHKSPVPKKPRLQADSDDDNSRCSTPASSICSTPVSRSSSRLASRGVTREAASRSRAFLHVIQQQAGDDSEDVVEGDETSDFEEDLEEDVPSDDSLDEVESVYSETSTVSSSRRKYLPKRPKTPEYGVDEKDIPPLVLPTSSTDLLVEGADLLQALGVYEVIRHFRTILRLSPFRFEDFCAALLSDEQSCLLSEIHMCLIRALQREEEGNSTTFGPQDLKDSINVSVFFLDAMTWPEVMRIYLESDTSAEFRSGLPVLEKQDYCSTTLSERLQLLQTTTDLFLQTNIVREEIMNEGNIRYDDHCRCCHRLGDLLCCETCPAVYHLTCVEPPMETVPEEDWLCSVCKAHQVKGVTECVSEAEKNGLLCRQEPLGYDRHKRKYFFMCRRIFVEGENEVWYYSSRTQLEEMVSALDAELWEKDLVQAIDETREDIVKQMQLTEELTKKCKGNKKSRLDYEDIQLLKMHTERAQKKAKEEEELKKKEEEEAKKKKVPTATLR